MVSSLPAWSALHVPSSIHALGPRPKTPRTHLNNTRPSAAFVVPPATTPTPSQRPVSRSHLALLFLVRVARMSAHRQQTFNPQLLRPSRSVSDRATIANTNLAVFKPHHLVSGRRLPRLPPQPVLHGVLVPKPLGPRSSPLSRCGTTTTLPRNSTRT
jgi:hypothetical protein